MDYLFTYPKLWSNVDTDQYRRILFFRAAGATVARLTPVSGYIRRLSVYVVILENYP